MCNMEEPLRAATTDHEETLLRFLRETVASHGQLIRLGGQHEATTNLLRLFDALDRISVLRAAQRTQRGVQVLAPMMRRQAEGCRCAYTVPMSLALLPLTLVLACKDKRGKRRTQMNWKL